MANRRTWLILCVAILLLGSLSAAMAFASTPSQTLPAPAMGPVARSESDGPIVHTVKRGETLSMIARRYGVSVRELAAYNGITNPDRIYVGQVLRIPRTGQPTVVPQPTGVPPQPTVTPVPTASGPTGLVEEEIIIQAPARGVTITNPVVVSGLAASPFEQTVVVAVLDATGGQIAQVAATITGEYGQRGPFSVTVPFTQPVNSQPGRIQVYTTSPRDGALEHLSSVSVMLQGADLDALLDQLETAVNAKDYARLQTLMGPKFSLSRYQANTVELTPTEAIDQLRGELMGPGKPRLDFSIDARALLGSRFTFSPAISQVVYSPGWGPNQNDDAFLMIGTVDGQARWEGLLYVPHALIDYRVVGRTTTG